jgi:hypothetical protein
MPTTIEERWGSRRWSKGPNPTFEYLWTVKGTEDETEVRDLIETTSPASYFDLELDTTSAEQVGPELWFGAARYAYPGSESEYSFQLGGGSVHITHSRSTIASYPASGFAAAPNFQNGVNVTTEAVEGVDIDWPDYTFSETHYFDDSFVTAGYKATLFELCKCTNNATFKGFAAGEVRLLGVEGSKRGSRERWALTYNFKASENATSLVVGPITGIAKKGWEYLWVYTMEAEDATAKMLVKRPIAVYVEEVYPSGDFSLLGIGT